MTQEERWQQQYEQMMSFMETNHRRPSKHKLEEHDMLNWFKATKKRIAKGELSEERLKKFNVLLEVADKYRRLNQYKLLLSAKTFSSHIKNKVVILAWIPTFFVTFVFAPKHQ